MESKLKNNKQVKKKPQNCSDSSVMALLMPLDLDSLTQRQWLHQARLQIAALELTFSFETIGGCDLFWEAGWHHYSSVCLAVWQQSLSASSRVARGPSSSSKNALNIRVWQPEGHAQKVTGQCSQSYEKKMHWSNCHQHSWLAEECKSLANNVLHYVLFIVCFN